MTSSIMMMKSYNGHVDTYYDTMLKLTESENLYVQYLTGTLTVKTLIEGEIAKDIGRILSTFKPPCVIFRMDVFETIDRFLCCFFAMYKFKSGSESGTVSVIHELSVKDERHNGLNCLLTLRSEPANHVAKPSSDFTKQLRTTLEKFCSTYGMYVFEITNN